MAINLINQTKGGYPGWPSMDTTGANALVAVVLHTHSGAVIDSRGNTWVARNLVEAAGSSYRVQIFDCVNPTSVGAGHQLSHSQGSVFPGTIHFYAFDADGTLTFASQSGAQDATFHATSAQPGSLTPGTNDALLVVGAGTSNATTHGINSGFTVGQTSGVGGYSGYLNQTTAAAINPTLSWTSNGRWAVAMTAYNHAPPPSPPTIDTHPSNQTVTAPTTATFSVTASGTGLSYQWQRQPSGGGGFSNISGATNSSYTTPATTVTGGTANNGDQYRCVVTNAGGSVTSNAATLTVNAPDNPPTLSGSITVSNLLPTSYTLSWPSGSDDNGVASYEVSLNGGTNYTDVGNVLTTNITGRTPNTTDNVRVRAKDTIGQVSSPALSTTVNLPDDTDTVPPTMTGTVTVTPGIVTASVLCPTASDNVGVVAYDASLNGGSTWPFTSGTPTIGLTGLTAETAYTVHVRARDAAGNVSSPLLSANFTTQAPVTATITTDVLKNWSGAVLASLTIQRVLVLAMNGSVVLNLSNLATNGSGILSINSGSLVAGTQYMVATWNSDGTVRGIKRYTAA